MRGSTIASRSPDAVAGSRAGSVRSSGAESLHETRGGSIHQRRREPTSFAPFEARVKALLAEFPDMPSVDKRSVDDDRVGSPRRDLARGA